MSWLEFSILCSLALRQRCLGRPGIVCAVGFDLSMIPSLMTSYDRAGLPNVLSQVQVPSHTLALRTLPRKPIAITACFRNRELPLYQSQILQDLIHHFTSSGRHTSSSSSNMCHCLYENSACYEVICLPYSPAWQKTLGNLPQSSRHSSRQGISSSRLALTLGNHGPMRRRHLQVSADIDSNGRL